MPIYEYICSDCGKRFEQMRSIKKRTVPLPARIAPVSTHPEPSLFSSPQVVGEL